jgi:hypothetical protein
LDIWNYWLYYIYFNRFGTWGICFIYGTLYAVKGLVAAGRTYDNCSFIQKACTFLLSKQLFVQVDGVSHICLLKLRYTTIASPISLCFLILKHIRALCTFVLKREETKT